ncbi:MAG: hypothetical protein J2P36_30825, partial [Ktedonobacteraceae bacterium]|nr:hypothetical protein [Ktedonobacteraceae bacterium]
PSAVAIATRLTNAFASNNQISIMFSFLEMKKMFLCAQEFEEVSRVSSSFTKSVSEPYGLIPCFGIYRLILLDQYEPIQKLSIEM